MPVFKVWFQISLFAEISYFFVAWLLTAATPIDDACGIGITPHFLHLEGKPTEPQQLNIRLFEYAKKAVNPP